MAFDEVGSTVGERGERKREELLVGNDDEPLLKVRGDGRDEQLVAAAQQLGEGRGLVFLLAAAGVAALEALARVVVIGRHHGPFAARVPRVHTDRAARLLDEVVDGSLGAVERDLLERGELTARAQHPRKELVGNARIHENARLLRPGGLGRIFCGVTSSRSRPCDE